MAEYRRSAHAVFDLKYHLVWITKYRYKILKGRLAERARDLIRQTCQARGVVIVRGAVSPDHIHMLVSAPPELTPAKMVQYIYQGAVVAAVTGGVSGAAEALLGATPVGARVLLCDGGGGGREDGSGVHRESEMG
jgi:putative transposase